MVINGGRYSKFQERLKNIVRNRFRLKKKRLIKEETKDFEFNKVQEIFYVKPEENIVKPNINVKNVSVTKKAGVKKVNSGGKKIGVGTVYNVDDNKQIFREKDNSKEKVILNDKHAYTLHEKKNVKKDIDSLELFGLELISKIKDSFNDKIDQLDVLESELYLLSVNQDNTLELKKVKEIKGKIEELIKEINDIIDKYNLYNKNYYIEHVIGIDDKIIEDDIIYYREFLDSRSKEKDFVKEYKMLDEFKSLYSRLVVVKHDTEVLMEENEEKTRDFDIRDKKYSIIVDKLVRFDDTQKECLDKVNNLAADLKQLNSKIGIINKEEYVTTHLKGLDELVGQSLKFLGLKLLSPFSGLIPSIAINTLMTKRMIANVYKNLHFEEVKHVYYTAVNYDREVNDKIFDIGYAEDIVNGTLNDIKKLREDFLLQYNSDITGYKNTLKKIDDIEELICRNLNKIKIVKRQAIMSKRINEDKMVKVKRMNENSN